MPKTRGLALITVLIAASLLAMLSVSLVLLSRSNFVSGEQYRRRQVLLQCCYSGVDYARARLAQQVNWGTVAMVDHLVHPEIEATESGGQVSGVLVSSGGRFHVQVVNNLRGLARLGPPPWSRSRVNIPPRCALVAVDGEYEGLSRRVEVLLTRRSLLSHSVVAGRDLAIQVPASLANPALEFKSVLPRGNEARAGGEIYLPKATQLRFLPQGQIKSAGDIHIDSQLTFDSGGNASLTSGTSLKFHPTAVAAASAALGASLHTDASLGQSRFQPDKLAVPGGATLQLQPGEYRFTQPDRVAYFDPAGNPAGSFSQGQLPGVTLKDYQFIPHGNVEVHGNLTLSGNITAMQFHPPAPSQTFGSLTAAAPQPFRASLGLGYDANGLPVGGQTRNRFTVYGDLTVHGDLVGRGQLFVKSTGPDGGNLKVEGNSFLSATRTDGLAIVADRDTLFAEVASTAYQAPFAMGQSDFEAFGGAIFNTPMSDSISHKVFHDFTQASQAELQHMATQLLARPLMDRNAYRDVVRSMLGLSPGGAWPPVGGSTLGGLDLDRLPFDYVDSGGNHATVSCLQGLAHYLNDMGPGQVTLEEHLRIREFLKSLDQGTFQFEQISPFLPGAPAPPYNRPDLYQHLVSVVTNQVGTYYQDARFAGLDLYAYMSTANRYRESSRRDFTFGGILYAGKNIFIRLASSFRVAGSLISQDGTVGFDNVVNGTLLFDPGACEDQFEWSRLGLGVLFFWTQ